MLTVSHHVQSTLNEEEHLIKSIYYTIFFAMHTRMLKNMHRFCHSHFYLSHVMYTGRPALPYWQVMQ